MNRKDFIRYSTLLTTSSLFFKSNELFAGAPQDIRVGLIGVNGMGWSDLDAILKIEGVSCLALCDVDERILEKRVAELAQKNIQVEKYTDYRELLKNPKINTIIIGTPDHWHCLQMVDAVKAGKHVYVEKPIGNSIEECQLMVAAAKKHKAIVQVGQWQRSQQHFKDAIDFLHTGKLGKVRLVKAWSYQGWKNSIPILADEQVPSGVHYDQWLGPAQKRPFNQNRFHFNFRWFWDYAGGLMTDWGVHMLDYALLGMKVSDPKSVMAAGGKLAYPDDAGETPDTMTAVYEFENFNIQWEHAKGIDLGPYGRNHGVAFIGNNGTLVLNREGWEVIPEKGRMEAVVFQPSKDNGLEKHMQNFVEAISKRDSSLLHAPIEAGAHIAIFSQMGNIAYRTGKKLYWNKERSNFDDKKSNQYLAAVYHNGYTYPKI
ncbi:Gfo/Idh/MocA family oxidoreductase [Sphingobacterium sp. SRCM116780]|uniref:Gfo/Idh/MocA family protein n=1 Tax=Sphingobacterium sp. SRCM116780 TaxID=2907623 RepID=UPI001F3B86B8|nr:Gfo/Idh/MocA family oxidoreductase [Sphingobacterium sp. SRCM116780]UIR54647.1 Gfo/Idh/MocA family oxidoreductase [Sphingobacterium sp. SRCM116780]